MTKKTNESNLESTRRGFIKNTSLGLAGVAAVSGFPLIRTSRAASDFEVRIGLIGCGGRGTGAVLDAVGAATKVIYPQKGYHTEDVDEDAVIVRKNIKIAALADLFEERLDHCNNQLSLLGIDVPKTKCFSGIDAYQQLLALPDVNYVILATPPHFRPVQLKATIEAGKNVFIEKPVAVDVPGVRMVMEAGKLAKEKGIGIAGGTQRRHQKSFQETIKRIQDGAIGDMIYAKCYWNGGQIWVIDRQPGWTDIEWQLRNWNYFTWLSGDHIVEQHVHNLDIMNWVIGSHPVQAVSGLGGRQVRIGDRHGHIFDHFAVEYEYPNGVTMFSQCRQINDTQNKVMEHVVGSQGTSNCQNRIDPKSGARWRFMEDQLSPYQQEHMDLIESIKTGNPINEAQAIAESTMTGIIGREAVYSGQAIQWDRAMKSETRLGPDSFDIDPYPIPEVAMPGTYRFR